MKVLLFSGGIDSTCVAYGERPDRLAFVNYGQIPANGEVRACRAIAAQIGLPFDELRADLRQFGSGTMAGRASDQHGTAAEFWPYRNQMLITLAAMAYFETGLSELIIGTVSSDEQHSDGRAGFRTAMAAVLASQSDVTLRAPAASLLTQELVAKVDLPGSLLGWTFSCHTGEWACGRCGGCRKNAEVKAFASR